MTDTDANATAIDTAAAEAREAALKEILRAYPSLAVAYSGGVDSAFLADVAHEVLGPRSQMVIADSPSLPRSEFADATQLAKDRGWNLVVRSLLLDD